LGKGEGNELSLGEGWFNKIFYPCSKVLDYPGCRVFAVVGPLIANQASCGWSTSICHHSYLYNVTTHLRECRTRGDAQIFPFLEAATAGGFLESYLYFLGA